MRRDRQIKVFACKEKECKDGERQMKAKEGGRVKNESKK